MAAAIHLPDRERGAARELLNSQVGRGIGHDGECPASASKIAIRGEGFDEDVVSWVQSDDDGGSIVLAIEGEVALAGDELAGGSPTRIAEDVEAGSTQRLVMLVGFLVDQVARRVDWCVPDGEGEGAKSGRKRKRLVWPSEESGRRLCLHKHIDAGNLAGHEDETVGYIRGAAVSGDEITSLPIAQILVEIEAGPRQGIVPIIDLDNPDGSATVGKLEGDCRRLPRGDRELLLTPNDEPLGHITSHEEIGAGLDPSYRRDAIASIIGVTSLTRIRSLPATIVHEHGVAGIENGRV